MSATLAPPSAEPAAPPGPVAPPRPRRFGRAGRRVLGLAWLHGQFHASVLERGDSVAEWASPAAVKSLAEFAAALEEAQQRLSFRGGEAHLILEQENFQHRLEQGPAASESAARLYLRSLVGRLEEGGEPLLWASEPAGRARREASWCLHLLPSHVYQQLHQLLRAHHLELTRLVPLTLALHLELNALPEAQDAPVLIAATTGQGTVLLAAQAHQPLLFVRVLRESWNLDPSRVGVEINRSLFYAKQQFGTVIQRIQLRGPIAAGVRAEIHARCSGGPAVAAAPARPALWLQSIAKLPAAHRVNLLAGYLRRRRRDRLVRSAVIACCWLALAITALDHLRESQRWTDERTHLEQLTAELPRRQAEEQRLLARNAAADRHGRLVAAIEADRLPPVAPRFLAFLAESLPADVQLTAFAVQSDPAGRRWAFHLQGLADGSAETARDRLAGWQALLEAGPFRPRFMDTQNLAVLPVAGPEAMPRTRFVLEGELFAR